MIAPGAKQIIQVITTSHCNLACGNCTEIIAQQTNRYHMSVPNFRRAVESLVDWHGIVGVFGGNPCLHPEFPELCAVMRELLPPARRGLWTNRLFGHGEVVRETFGQGYMNLVVHDDHAAAEEMRAAGLGPVHGDGRRAWHSPILVALSDVEPNEAERLRLIEGCDINRFWSGAIDQDADGNLRAWYCEVASSLARAYNAPVGIPVTPGWWRLGMEAWKGDVSRWCHSCGVPLRLKGHEDMAYTDDYSQAHAGLIKLKPRRAAVLHETKAGPRAEVATDYLRLRTREEVPA